MSAPEHRSYSRTFKVVMLTLGRAMASIAGFVILAVLSRFFTKHEYATYRQLLLCFTLVMPILTMGVPMALYYYLPTEKRNSREILGNNFTILAALGLLYTIFILGGGAGLWAAKMGNPGLEDLLYIAAPYGLILLLRSALPACFMSADKPKILAVFNALSRSFECVLIVLAVIFFGSLPAAVIGTVIGAALALAIGMIIVFRLYSSGSLAPSFIGVKKQLSYGVPLGLAAVFGSMMGYVDQLIVSLKCSSEDFAIYVNGAIRLPLFSIVVMSVASVLLPELSVMYKNSDRKGMLELWQKAMIKSSYVVIPVTMFLMVLAGDAIFFLFSNEYAESVPIFRVFLILLPFQMISYGPIFHASNKNKYIALINIVTLVFHIPLILFAVGRFGIIGAVVSTVFSQICIRVLLHIVFIGKITNCPSWKVIPFARLLRVFLPACLLALPLACRYFFDFSSFVSLVIFAAFYFPICYLWLTRKANAPRISFLEGFLDSIWSTIAGRYKVHQGHSGD